MVSFAARESPQKRMPKKRGVEGGQQGILPIRHEANRVRIRSGELQGAHFPNRPKVHTQKVDPREHDLREDHELRG